MEKDWIQLFATTDSYKAEMIRQTLADHNINAVVINKQDSSYGLFGQVELYTHQDHQEEAQQIIREIIEADADTGNSTE